MALKEDQGGPGVFERCAMPGELQFSVWGPVPSPELGAGVGAGYGLSLRSCRPRPAPDSRRRPRAAAAPPTPIAPPTRSPSETRWEGMVPKRPKTHSPLPHLQAPSVQTFASSGPLC